MVLYDRILVADFIAISYTWNLSKSGIFVRAAVPTGRRPLLWNHHDLLLITGGEVLRKIPLYSSHRLNQTQRQELKIK